MKEKSIQNKENYTERITVRFTAEELKRIKQKAMETNLDPSVLIRKGSLNTRIISKTDNLTLVQLKRIGNNINQIARVVNAEKTSVKSLNEIAISLKELQQNLNNIIEKLK